MVNRSLLSSTETSNLDTVSITGKSLMEKPAGKQSSSHHHGLKLNNSKTTKTVGLKEALNKTCSN